MARISIHPDARTGCDQPRPDPIAGALGDGYARLLAVTRRITGDEDEARDSVQDACASALKARDTFGHRARPSTWLHRIAVNAALMRRRRQRRRREEPADLATPPGLTQGLTAPSAEEVVASARIRAIVQRAIASLPVNHRTVLELRDVHDLDTADAANALGLTTNAAKIRLHRARHALRAVLAVQGLETARA